MNDGKVRITWEPPDSAYVAVIECEYMIFELDDDSRAAEFWPEEAKLVSVERDHDAERLPTPEAIVQEWIAALNEEDLYRELAR